MRAPVRASMSARIDGTTPVLEVADDGPGIPEAERNDVWERFYRGEGAQAVTSSGRPGCRSSSGSPNSIARRSRSAPRTADAGCPSRCAFRSRPDARATHDARLFHRLCWQACGQPAINDTKPLIGKGLPVVRGNAQPGQLTTRFSCRRRFARSGGRSRFRGCWRDARRGNTVAPSDSRPAGARAILDMNDDGTAARIRTDSLAHVIELAVQLVVAVPEIPERVLLRRDRLVAEVDRVALSDDR